MQPTMHLRYVVKHENDANPFMPEIYRGKEVKVLQQYWIEEAGLGMGMLANRSKGEWRDVFTLPDTNEPPRKETNELFG